jgi:hypothetical protein
MKKTSLIALTLCIMAGCREPVQEEFPAYGPVPTVNSILIAGRACRVHVSLAGKIDAHRLKVIEDATVYLACDGEESLLQPEGGGVYTSGRIPEAGKTYTCRVEIPGFPPVTCQERLPGKPECLAIKHINKAGRDEEGVFYPALEFTFKNPPGDTSYFEGKLHLFGDDGYRMEGEIHTLTDPVLQSEGLPLLLFSNQLIEDTIYTTRVNYKTGSMDWISDGIWQTELYPLVFEFRAVSRDYYKYMQQYYLYEQGRYPEFNFGPSLAFQLHSNIENAHGIFAGYSAMVSETIYPNDTIQ